MAFNIMPRKYEPDELIIANGEFFSEMYFIIEGEIFANVNYGDIVVGRYFSDGYYVGKLLFFVIVGDFNILFDRPSIFELRAHTETKVYTLPKEKLLSILKLDEAI
jgi:CRP-like cAMP-binding protein